MEIQDSTHKILEVHENIVKDFTEKLDEDVNAVSKKVDKMVTYHIALAHTVTELCSIVMIELEQNALNPVEALAVVNTSGRVNGDNIVCGWD